MAKVTLNPMIKTASGKVGDVVFRRLQNGEMSIIKLADMSQVKWSKAQEEQRTRFKAAVAYAKAALADPKVRAIYEKLAKKVNKRAYDVAKSDYFKGRDLLSGKRK